MTKTGRRTVTLMSLSLSLMSCDKSDFSTDDPATCAAAHDVMIARLNKTNLKNDPGMKALYREKRFEVSRLAREASPSDAGARVFKMRDLFRKDVDKAMEASKACVEAAYVIRNVELIKRENNGS